MNDSLPQRAKLTVLGHRTSDDHMATLVLLQEADGSWLVRLDTDEARLGQVDIIRLANDLLERA